MPPLQPLPLPLFSRLELFLGYQKPFLVGVNCFSGKFRATLNRLIFFSTAFARRDGGYVFGEDGSGVGVGVLAVEIRRIEFLFHGVRKKTSQ